MSTEEILDDADYFTWVFFTSTFQGNKVFN